MTGHANRKIERHFAPYPAGAYADIAFAITDCDIRKPDGPVTFERDDVQVLAAFSQPASDVMLRTFFKP